MNFYNENDPFAAEWLRQLIALGEIPSGVVDERSIIEIEPNELEDFKQCHFFAGIGVWAYAIKQADWPKEKQVWTGSCPCQPFSNAGSKLGINDERHLWPAWFKLIKHCKPTVIFGEQVASAQVIGKVKANHESVWIDQVQTDLEKSHYATGFAVLPACGFGAPHVRQRLWFLANTGGVRQSRPGQLETPSNSKASALGKVDNVVHDSDIDSRQNSKNFWCDVDWYNFKDGKKRCVESGSYPLVNGSADILGSSGDIGQQEIESTNEASKFRLKGYGNALVAPQAIEFVKAAVCSRVVKAAYRFRHDPCWHC